MNVWIANPFDSLPLEGHRPQRYWLMARAFAQAGCTVRLWTSDFSHATKRKRQLVSENRETFRVELLPTLPYTANVCLARVRSHNQLAKTFVSRAREFISRGERPDLIIASTPPLGLCASAVKIAKSCNACFVCDIQDAWPETFLRLLPNGFKWSGHAIFAPMFATARNVYREADLVTGVCQRYAELSGRNDFHLAYLGIEGTAITPRTPAGKISRLAYVGNLGAGYDLATVLDTIAKRQELSLDIAGFGPREGELRRRCQRLGIAARVLFHGFLNETELQSLLAQCDAGIIPMRDDSWVGLPNKLLDYLKAGLPVLSSLHGECEALLARTGFGRAYALHSADSFLAALDALPKTQVSLPDELRAERIYPKYAAHVLSVCGRNRSL